MRCSRENSERGFTLVELLIAMAISLVVLTSLSSAFMSQRKTYAVQEQITEMIQGARGAMDIISREIMMAGYDPMRAGIVGIPYSATQLEIKADLNGDGDTIDLNETIIYTSSGTTIERLDEQVDLTTTVTLAENSTFGFTYWENDGTTKVISAANEGNIRQIDITITTKTSKPDPNYSHPVNNDGYRTYTLSSRVTPPNLEL